MAIILYMMYVSPPCRAVLMTARHIGVEVRIQEQNSSTSRDFLKINPRGCVPTIDDSGFYLWESRAIMTYLMNKYAPHNSLYPKEPEKRAIVDMMLSYDHGTLYKAQVEYLYPQIFYGEVPLKEHEISYRNSLSILDRALAVNPFVAGKHLTLADLSIVANLALAETYEYDFGSFPNLLSWLKTLKRKLPYFSEVNEIPLLHFKFCCGYNIAFEGEKDEVNSFYETKL